MKKIAYVLLAGSFLVLIIGSVFWAKTLMNRRVNNVPAESVAATIMVNLPPIATSISTTSTSLPDYEVLSPDKIKKDNLIFDVVAGLYTCAELQVEVQGIFPPDYKFPSTSLDVEGRGLYIFDDLKITTSSPKISLKLDPSFGGGGSSNINNSYVLA